jgi:hypothetical protein
MCGRSPVRCSACSDYMRNEDKIATFQNGHLSPLVTLAVLHK